MYMYMYMCIYIYICIITLYHIILYHIIVYYMIVSYIVFSSLRASDGAAAPKRPSSLAPAPEAAALVYIYIYIYMYMYICTYINHCNCDHRLLRNRCQNGLRFTKQMWLQLQFFVGAATRGVAEGECRSRRQRGGRGGQR